MSDTECLACVTRPGGPRATLAEFRQLSRGVIDVFLKRALCFGHFDGNRSVFLWKFFLLEYLDDILVFIFKLIILV